VWRAPPFERACEGISTRAERRARVAGLNRPRDDESLAPVAITQWHHRCARVHRTAVTATNVIVNECLRTQRSDDDAFGLFMNIAAHHDAAQSRRDRRRTSCAL